MPCLFRLRNTSDRSGRTEATCGQTAAAKPAGSAAVEEINIKPGWSLTRLGGSSSSQRPPPALPAGSRSVKRGLPLLSAELVERAAFRMMSYTGKPPEEDDPEGGAAENVRALADEVAGLLGMPTWQRVTA